jgi:hypothetical protein
MNRRQLLFRLLFKAAWVRKDRALTALVSVAVVATIATAALTIYSDLEGKLGHEFRGFGANVIVTKTSGPLNAGELAKISAAVGAKAKVVPVAYAIAAGPNDAKVVIAGADLQALRELNSWWSVRPVETPGGKAWIGAHAATLFAPTGGKFDLTFGSRRAEIHPQMIFTTGSEDDSRIYLDLAEFSALTTMASIVTSRASLGSGRREFSSIILVSKA